MAASILCRDPDTPRERLDMERAEPLRAPLAAAVGAALRPGLSIPIWDQKAAASGTMNLLNALNAQGFGAIWLSSEALLYPAVKAALDFAETDALLGWIVARRKSSVRARYRAILRDICGSGTAHK